VPSIRSARMTCFASNSGAISPTRAALIDQLWAATIELAPH
jgi:hypothetical protein